MADGQHAPGQELGNGRFVVVRVLGTGSQAETFEAVDKVAGRRVALKRFVVKNAQSWKDVELAEREAKVLSGLNYPLLPHYVTHFEEDGSLYLAMELIEGSSLQELRTSGGLGQADIIALLKDTAATLDYLHGRSPPIIHRDIKPRNIVRRPDGRFVLVDFGSVRDRLKPDGGSTVVGTFGYMAPEQFQGRAMPASDTYAAAATALSLLTAQEPEHLPHKGLAIDVTRALSGSTTPQLEALLKVALDPDPDKRGAQSLSQLLKRHGFSNQQASSQASYSTPHTAKKATRGFRYDAEAYRERFEHTVRDEMRRGRLRERHHRREHEAADSAHAEAWSQPKKQRKVRHHGEALQHLPDHGVARIPPPIWLGLIVLFTLLRVVLGLALRIAIPVVLNVLGVLLFGPDLRRAALRVREAGKEAQRELREAQTRLSLGRGEDSRTAEKVARVNSLEAELDTAVEAAERNAFRP